MTHLKKKEKKKEKPIFVYSFLVLFGKYKIGIDTQFYRMKIPAK